MRDKIKDKQYFIEYIEEEMNRIERFQSKLNANEVKKDRILPVKIEINNIKLGILIARYSMGEDINLLVNDYNEIVKGMQEGFWYEDWYDYILWMLSIGIMLEVDDKEFDILADLVDKSNKNDWLYNFLMHFRKKDINFENSRVLFDIPYKAIYDIVNSRDNHIDKIEDYLKNKWYKGHSGQGWYECHKSKENLYFGYWSFESGAIVKILGLDDEKLKNILYYPYDMVHYKK